MRGDLSNSLQKNQSIEKLKANECLPSLLGSPGNASELATVLPGDFEMRQGQMGSLDCH